MNPKLKHRAVVLAVLLAIPYALLAEENKQNAVKPEKGLSFKFFTSDRSWGHWPRHVSQT